MKSVMQLFKNVATDPGTMFAAGNLLLAANVAEIEGIIISAGALALTSGLQLYKTVTGKDGFNSLYFTASANFITAASALYSSGFTEGDWHTGIAAALTFTGWGLSHIFLAKLAVNNGQHGKVADNPFFYSMIGNISSFQIHDFRLLPSLFVLAAATRSFLVQKGPDAKTTNLQDTFRKHTTAVKFTMLGFVAGGIQSALTGDMSYAASQAVWAWAALNLDAQYNKNLMQDIKTAARAKPAAP